MKIKLSKDVLGGLPAPDDQGLTRCMASLRITPEGEAELVELNDMPVPSDDDTEREPEDESYGLRSAAREIYNEPI